MVFKYRRKRDERKKESLVTNTVPNSKIAEEYRTIRTNLQFSSINGKDKTIVITSPRFGEGKSTIAANLAVSIAQQGEKVLVIDADLRKPTIHEIFQLENTIGLTSVLGGKKVMEGAVKKTGIGRLHVLTSGPVPLNPAELLGSVVMENLIQKVMDQYDIILIDSPPILEVADTSILADRCDGALLVVNYNRTMNEDAIEAKRLLSFTKGKLVGAILNNKR
ncbi:CpsD/CapB family tyrosine-protein kinase [Bacillus sp. WLY-B-L8]|uniref:CpsD/CapB family tyrosine-protein kinase n=1 Tax=Bacillus multifaciens TaxID=3068506 RepID=UPI00274269F2|nr:CpsD/CapB family tyrosine-protein kinase [Bacillus sp. WLY-B-L8]MDP7979569.1 CpsD/CapB family tyrosine-protein kinase [Bacillus sp. WLY-B-L8]